MIEYVINRKVVLPGVASNRCSQIANSASMAAFNIIDLMKYSVQASIVYICKYTGSLQLTVMAAKASLAGHRKRKPGGSTIAVTHQLRNYHSFGRDFPSL